MSDLKKQLDKEYLVKDIFKLIMESNEPGERGSAIPAPKWSEEEQTSQNFYQVAIDKYTSAPSNYDAQQLKNHKRFNGVFGFNENDNIRVRIEKINRTYSSVQDASTTIPAALNTLEVLSTFYKIINHYDGPTAGFLTENLVAILTGGEIPAGNPIEDVVVKDKESGKVLKAYSLKTYTGISNFGGNFPNLIKFFNENPKIEYISYIYLMKKKGSSNNLVTSLQIYEKKFSLSTRGKSKSGHQTYNIFNELVNIEKFLSPFHITRQRYDFIKSQLGDERANLLNSIMGDDINLIDYSEADLEQLKYEMMQQGNFAISRYVPTKREENFNILNDMLQSHAVERYSNNLIAKIQKLKEQPSDEEIRNFVKQFILTNEFDKNNVNKQTQFEFSAQKMIAEPDNYVGEINIELENFMALLHTNANLLGNIVHEAYRTLNALDNSINSFFKDVGAQEQHRTNCVKYADDMVKQVSRFKEIPKSDFSKNIQQPLPDSSQLTQKSPLAIPLGRYKNQRYR